MCHMRRNVKQIWESQLRNHNKKENLGLLWIEVIVRTTKWIEKATQVPIKTWFIIRWGAIS